MKNSNIDFTNNENTCGCIYIVRDPRNIVTSIKDYYEMDTYEEAQEKLQKGMKILIREGSAAKNFEALIDFM